MPNNHVFTGADASLVLAVDDNAVAEGSQADSLLAEYDLSSVVGRLQHVQVRVENDVKPYHEIGQRYPTELRPGNLNVSGSAQRAHLNGALIRLLLGEGANSPPPVGLLVQPAFNIVVNLQNPALPDNMSRVILFGVKFDSWSFAIPEDDFVIEGVTFKALRLGTEEASA